MDRSLYANPREGLLGLQGSPGTKTKLGSGHRVKYGTKKGGSEHQGPIGIGERGAEEGQPIRGTNRITEVEQCSKT